MTKLEKHRLRVTQTRAIACLDPSCNVCLNEIMQVESIFVIINAAALL